MYTIGYIVDAQGGYPESEKIIKVQIKYKGKFEWPPLFKTKKAAEEFMGTLEYNFGRMFVVELVAQ